MESLSYVYWPTRLPLPAETAFLDHVNGKINQVNQLIEAYNRAPSALTLKPIYKAFCEFEAPYSAKQILACPAYQAIIHTRFFQLLQKEAKRLRIHLTDLQDDPPAPDPFTTILSQMAPHKVAAMIKLLTQARMEELQTLYQDSEEGYRAYHDFMRRHAISYLGGGNSLNFKVTPIDGGPEFVIKIDNRLGMPKKMERILRQDEALREAFVPVFAERHATFLSDGGHCYRTLQTTELLTAGDIESAALKDKSPVKRVEEALDIYIQMASLLTKISAAGAASPDMKNSNWLIDAELNVRIADTKGFVPTHQGWIDSSFTSQQWYNGLLHTSFMMAPEIKEYFTTQQTRSPTRIDADKMHAYMLGKNLYQYLSKCPSLALEPLPNPLVFPEPLGTPGEPLRHLLNNLLQKNPARRPSMTETLRILKDIRYKITLTRCMNEFRVIQPLVTPDVFKKLLEPLKNDINFKELEPFRNQLKDHLCPTLQSPEHRALKAFVEQLSRPRPRTDLYGPEEIVKIQRDFHSMPLSKPFSPQRLAEKLSQLQLDVYKREAEIILTKIQTLDYGVITTEIQQYCRHLHTKLQEITHERPADVGVFKGQLEDAYNQFFTPLAFPYTEKFIRPENLVPQLQTLLKNLIPLTSESEKMTTLADLNALKFGYHTNECNHFLSTLKPLLSDRTYTKLMSKLKDIHSAPQLNAFKAHLEQLVPTLSSDEHKALIALFKTLEQPDYRRGLYTLTEYNALSNRIELLPLQEGFSVALVKKMLDSVKADLVYRECKKMIKTIAMQGFGQNDQPLKLRCDQLTAGLNERHHLGIQALQAYKVEIERVAQQVNPYEASQIKQIIQDFRQRASFFTVGMKDKANKIEQAMANVPLEERGNILRSTSRAAIDVKEALARHRHWFSRKIYRNSDHSLDEAKAASSYLKFRRDASWVETHLAR